MKIRRLFSLSTYLDADDRRVLQDNGLRWFILGFGLVLLGYGASQFRDGAGPLLVGAVVILCVQPLSRLVK